MTLGELSASLDQAFMILKLCNWKFLETNISSFTRSATRPQLTKKPDSLGLASEEDVPVIARSVFVTDHLIIDQRNGLDCPIQQ